MKKILVVEDELSFLNLLHKELSAKGYTVVDAKNGKEGYDKAVTIHPDLIIMDLLMPDVDGITMLETLRKDKDGKNMKVIILTNLELDGDMMQRALKTKPLYYFVKTDVTLATIMEKVDEVLTDEDVEELADSEAEHAGIL